MLQELSVAVHLHYDGYFMLGRKYFLFFFTVQGGSAKKPYNPILGETFHCYWDLPSAQRTPPDETTKVALNAVQGRACVTQHPFVLTAEAFRDWARTLRQP